MATKTRDPKPDTRPTWAEYWATVGNETYLFARELIELSPDVRAHFAAFVGWRDDPVLVDDPAAPGWSVPDPDGWVWRDVDLDWHAAAQAADEWPASSTQVRLLDLVLSLIQPDEETEWQGDGNGGHRTGTRLMDARDLGSMGSWRGDVARILYRYITGQPPVGTLRIFGAR